MLTPETLCRVLFEDIGLPGDARLVVAYSGGCDSQVLLHALWKARLTHDFTLAAAHFDHGLATESAAWASECAAVCRRWDIPFCSERQVVVKQPGDSLEARARQMRYRWFNLVLKPGQVLLTAHHAADQAETVLLNLLRGGGVELLAGIPQRRVLSAEKSTQVVRPLLAFPQGMLAEYARHHQLSWLQDPSNQSLEFDRNYLRNAIIPALQDRWRGAVSSLATAAENCRAAADFLDETLRPLLAHCQAPAKRGVFCLVSPLSVDALRSLRQSPAPLSEPLSEQPMPSQSERFQITSLLRYWLHQNGYPSPSSKQLATLFQQVFVARSESASIRWAGVQLRYFAEHLYLTRQLDEGADTAAPMAWDLQDCDLGKNGLRIEIRQRGAAREDGDAPLLAPQRLRGKDLRLVWRKGGERITLPGRTHSSTLKKLYQQNAVPPWERDALPLLVIDDQVAWAYRIGPSATYCCPPTQAGINLHFTVPRR